MNLTKTVALLGAFLTLNIETSETKTFVSYHILQKELLILSYFYMHMTENSLNFIYLRGGYKTDTVAKRKTNGEYDCIIQQ